MNITNVPNAPMINEDGQVGHEWRIFFNQMVNQIHNFLSDERYLHPRVDTSDETKLNIEDNESGILYNNEEKSHKVNQGKVYPSAPSASFVNMATYVGELSTAQINEIPSGQRNSKTVYNTTTGQLLYGANDTFIPIS